MEFSLRYAKNLYSNNFSFILWPKMVPVKTVHSKVCGKSKTHIAAEYFKYHFLKGHLNVKL